MVRHVLFTSVLLCMAGLSAAAQTAERRPAGDVAQSQLRPPGAGYLQVLATHYGLTYVGRVVEVREQLVVFEECSGGSRSFRIEEIRRVTEVPESSVKDGEYWYPNPSGTRLLFGPTGRTLGRGESYFSDTMILLPSVAHGFTDRLSLAAGISLIPGLQLRDQVAYFIPKVGLVSKPNASVSIGALLLTAAHWDERVVGGVHVTGTFGGPHSSVTAGVSARFPGSGTALLLGGEHRMSRGLMLVSENWLAEEGTAIASLGLRTLSEKTSTTLAMYYVQTSGGGFVAPYLDFTVRR